MFKVPLSKHGIPKILNLNILQRFVSEPLLSYVAELASQEDTILNARPPTIYSLVNTFADANFIPPTWDSVILPAISKHHLFRGVNETAYSWLKFFENLCTIHYTDLTHIRTVLDRDYVYKYFLQHPKSKDRLNLLNLYQAVTLRSDNPLEHVNCQKELALAFDEHTVLMDLLIRSCYLIPVLGKEFVLQEIVTDYGHAIPYIVIQKIETGEFVNVTAYESPNRRGFIPLQNITCNDDERM